MLEFLTGATALPNLHPAVVHFPIACLPLAVAFDGADLVFRRQRWLAPAATALYIVGALSGWLALWAGERAADGLVDVPAAVQPRIGEHSDWAHYAWYALIAIAAIRLAVELRPRLKGHAGGRIGLLILGLGVLGLLGKAADLGGALVYEHGLAVKPAVPAPVAGPVEVPSEASAGGGSAPESSAEQRLMRNPDGSLRWVPAPDDADAFTAVLSATPGAEQDSVRALEPDGDGLLLAVDGASTYLLPGTFGDVQVEVELEWLDFEGSVGLVHHFQSEGEHGAFVLSSTGEAVLDDRRQGDRRVLDQQEAGAPGGLVVLAVSASGKHLKGLLGGKTVTHGHISPGPDGSCGLRLDGRGRLRLLRMTVQPLQ